jgi:hypothetical protein
MYGLALANGVVLVVLGAAGAYVPWYVIVPVGLLGVGASACMIADAYFSYDEARRRSAGALAALPSLRPWVSAAAQPGPGGKRAVTYGLAAAWSF